MSDSRPIALFDSGIGGLSILLEIKKKLPLENFIYFADQAYFPYGTKTKVELEKRTNKIANFLIDKNAKMIVVACNTASVHTLSNLRNKIQLPIIGVVPAIKPATKLMSKKIGIMATPATFKSTEFQDLVRQFTHKKQVFKIKSNGLEEAVEQFDFAKIKSILEKSLSHINDLGIDTIVLGCTHYPLIKKQIKQILGSGITIIDSHKAIAKRVHNVLKLDNSQSISKTVETYFTTGNPDEFSKIASKLLKYNIQAQTIKL